MLKISVLSEIHQQVNDLLGDKQLYISFVIDDNDEAEHKMAELKKKGFASFLETTSFGNVIVLTDQIDLGD